MFNQSISIVLPAYNEEKNIKLMADKCLEYLSRNFKDYEIVIVDDGSTDSTGKVIDALADRHKGIIMAIHHYPNQGYGATLRTGLTSARNELIFYTDSDNQFDISQITEFMPYVDSYDILLGFRAPRRDPWFRLWISSGYNFLVSSLFSLHVKDVNSSFKIFHRDVIRKINITSKEFFVDAEIIAKARCNNFKILERPVRHFFRSQGNTTVNWRHVPSTLKEMFTVFKELRSVKSAK